MSELIDLLTNGGAVGIMAAIVIAFYTGRVVTKASMDSAIKTITDMWTDRFADERTEKEAWKAQAQQLAPAVAELSEELEAANVRDEAWKTALIARLEGSPDRRAT